MGNFFIIYNGSLHSSDEIYHHGVKGQKWGVRRYQKKDGSLTTAGKLRRKRLNDNEVDPKLLSRIKSSDDREGYAKLQSEIEKKVRKLACIQAS